MKFKHLLIIPLILLLSLVQANNVAYNQIENDHRIRNFAFIGPFPKTFNGDSLIKVVNSNQFSMDNALSYKGNTYSWVKPHPANGSLAFHNIWHIYPDIQIGEIVIAFAIVNSIKDQDIIADVRNFWYCKANIYVNSNKIYDLSTHRQGELIRGKLNSGNNNVCLKIEALGEPAINLAIYPESRIEISGKVMDKDGKPVPFARVRFYEVNKEKWYGDDADINGDYSFEIFPVNENGEYFAYVSGGEEKSSHKIVTGLKKGERKKFNFTVSKIFNNVLDILSFSFKTGITISRS